MLKFIRNPYHAEYFKWNYQSSIFGTIHYQDENLKLVSTDYNSQTA